MTGAHVVRAPARSPATFREAERDSRRVVGPGGSSNRAVCPGRASRAVRAAETVPDRVASFAPEGCLVRGGPTRTPAAFREAERDSRWVVGPGGLQTSGLPGESVARGACGGNRPGPGGVVAPIANRSGPALPADHGAGRVVQCAVRGERVAARPGVDAGEVGEPAPRLR